MKKYLLSIILFVMLIFNISAQNIWTLDDCIHHAVEHNIDLRQQAVDIQTKKVKLNTSKSAWLPVVNAELGEQFNFGNVSASTGTMSNTPANYDLAYTSANVKAIMPLFDGFRIPNQIKADRFSLAAATASLEKAKKDISIQVATVYLQCLYYKGLVKIAASQVKVGEHLRNDTRVTVEEGRRPQSELAEAESQLAADLYALVDAEGNAELSLLQLSQLLNLESTSGFDIVEEIAADDDVVPLPEEMYEKIVESFPSVVAARNHLEAGRYSWKVAKSSYYPQLSLEGSFNTYYLNLFHQTNSASFFRQLNNNRSELIGLRLSIPLFNRNINRNLVRQASLDVQSRILALDNAQLSLRKEIQQSYYNASVARSKRQAAEQSEAAARISFNYEQDRYQAGRSTIFDLKQINQKWMKSRQDALQAKYEHLIRERILQFYQR